MQRFLTIAFLHPKSIQDTNVFVKSGVGPLARKYYKEPIACNFVSYGSNVVASVKDEFKEIVETYLSKFEFYHCFETPNMHWLDERMKEKGYRVCFMAEYFLPDMERLKRLECNYVPKVLEQRFCRFVSSNVGECIVCR